MNETTDTKWYREPYVWLLISFPLAAVIGGIITLILAVRSDSGLVVDDYYQQGLEINRTLDRDQAAITYGLQARLQLPEKEGLFRIILSGNGKFSRPDRLNVKLLHSTRSGFDQHLSVINISNGVYQGQLPKLIRGKWHIMIEANDWRLLEKIIIP